MFIQTGLSSSVAAGISVVITVPVTAIITAIITIIIMYLLCIKHNKQSDVPPKKPDDVLTFTALDMSSNTAYGQTNCIPPTQSKPTELKMKKNTAYEQANSITSSQNKISPNLDDDYI